MLIIVRHGQSMANLTNSFAGHWDIDLSLSGVKQALASAKYVSENYKIDKIYSSDLLRAYNTAKALADIIGLEICKDSMLREIYAGKWEGLSFDEIENNYPDEHKIWCEDIGSCRIPEGESIAELFERTTNEFIRLAKESVGKCYYVATHATPIRSLMAYSEEKNCRIMKDIPWVTNASLTFADYENGELIIKEYGFDKHLKELKTEFPKNI